MDTFTSQFRWRCGQRLVSGAGETEYHRRTTDLVDLPLGGGVDDVAHGRAEDVALHDACAVAELRQGARRFFRSVNQNLQHTQRVGDTATARSRQCVAESE